MTPDDMINVIRQAQNGKTIECQRLGSTAWHAVEGPSWDFSNFRYRVKPALKDFWINEYKHLYVEAYQAHQSAAEANLAAGPNRIRCLHVREVEE